MPTVKAQVINGETGDPLDSAAVLIVNKDGVALGPGIKSGSDGKFSLTSSILSGNYLAISYTGLISVMMPASSFNDREYREIPLYTKELGEVIVTPHKRSGFWWLLGALAVVVVASSRENKKRKSYAR